LTVKVATRKPAALGVQVIAIFCAAPPSAMLKLVGETEKFAMFAPLKLALLTVKVVLPVSLICKLVLIGELTNTDPTFIVLEMAGLEL